VQKSEVFSRELLFQDMLGKLITFLFIKKQYNIKWPLL